MFGLFKRKPWPNGTISRKPEGKRYSDSWTTQPRTGRVTDEDIARYVIKHTYLWDRLDTHFVSDCVLEATDILWGYVKPPEGKWFFGKNYYGKWIEEDEWKKEHEFPHKDYEGSVDTIADVRFS